LYLQLEENSCDEGKVGLMFVRVQERKPGKDGRPLYRVSVLRSDRVKGKVVQTTVACFKAAEEDQVPYLQAAFAKNKPKLLYDDGSVYPPG
jgi:hypothetical protein